MAGALDGIRVVEFANYVSGPYAGMLLADMGAEIIKVETPGKGDPFRGWGRIEYSPTFGSVNRNKKSVTLDLKSPEGTAHALRLMEEAEPGSAGSARFSDASPEFDVNASAFLNRIAREFGRSGAILSAALAAMGDAFAPIGTADDPDARLPQLLNGLYTMQSDLDQWLGAASGNDIGGVGQSVSQALATAIRLGERAIRLAQEAQIDQHALLQRWLNDAEAVREEAVRPVWLLDGWDHIVRLWRGETGQDRRATVLEIAPMVPVLPEEAKSWTDTMVPPEAMDETCRVISHDDSWRRGAAAFALVERNEKLLA